MLERFLALKQVERNHFGEVFALFVRQSINVLAPNVSRYGKGDSSCAVAIESFFS